MSPKIFTLDTLRFINIINSLVLLCTQMQVVPSELYSFTPPRYAAYAQYCAQYAPQAVA